MSQTSSLLEELERAVSQGSERTRLAALSYATDLLMTGRYKEEDTWVFGRLPGTPHFKNVIAHAIEGAREIKSKEVCTEHLLLGLLAEKGSVAYAVLKALGISTRTVREEVLKSAPAEA